MAKNTNVTLGDHFEGFIAEQVEKGRYGASSELVREGLRLVDEREQKVDVLRAAVQEGFDSGPAEPFDIEEFIREVKSEAGLNP